LKAIKIVAGGLPAEGDQEFRGLVAYKEKALWMYSDALLPVEHANAISGGFFYVMPLADSLFDGVNPLDESWRPKTLAACVQCFKESGPWFNSDQICYLLTQLIGAAQVLEQAGLVHRDIKPENVLFLGGRPMLGDCGLVGPDKIELTRRGTPGYAAPRYYTDTGGSPDMYSLGALLYTLLTARSPDSSNLSARRAFWWPPAGEESLPEDEKQTWLRLRNVVLTALDEEKRYVSLEVFADAIRADNHAEAVVLSRTLDIPTPRTGGGLILPAIAGLAACVLALGIYLSHSKSSEPVPHPVEPNGAMPVTAAPSNQQVSPERLKELDAIVKEAQGKLDAYVPNVDGSGDEFTQTKEMLFALSNIDVTAPNADQQLKAFLDKYHKIRLPPSKANISDTELNDLYSYVGRIYDWAKTDPEKELAQVRSLDFNRKLTPLLNSHNEGMGQVSELQVEVDDYVSALCLKRFQAARDREKTLPDQAHIDDENRRASDFVTALQQWGKWVKRDN
jgi:serine/threonine protein kinase